MWIITHYKVCSYLFRHYNCQPSPLQLVQKVEIIRGKHGDTSMSNCFPSFIFRWILKFVDHPTHENPKKCYPTNKTISQYCLLLLTFAILHLTGLNNYILFSLLYSQRHTMINHCEIDLSPILVIWIHLMFY